MDPRTKSNEADGLDEDLFNFGELYAEDEENSSEEIDVEAFLAAADVDVSEAAVDGAPAAKSDDAELDEALASLPSSEELERLLRSAGASNGGGSLELTKLIKYGGIGLIAANLLAIGVVVSSSLDDSEQLASVKEELDKTVRDIRQDVGQQVDAIRGVDLPTAVVPLALEPETFDRVRRALDDGDFGTARRQLYAALSTVDRLDPEQRRSLEAEAGFLLADTYRLQAAQMEAIR
ncbi:MAG: hypothetical protein ACYSWX_09080 [Planctomycetota bacterium]